MLIVTNQANSEPSIAVSIEEIKSYGVITNTSNYCNSLSKILVYSDSSFTVIVDSIEAFRLVKYDRLSEILGIPYWAARKENRLKDGEKFRIFYDNKHGWIDDDNLMTFTSTWREREPEKYIKIDVNTAICAYSSGQNSSCGCNALTVWEKTTSQYKGTWELKSSIHNVTRVSLYSCLEVDELIRYSRNGIAIAVKSVGGDASDRWGTYGFFIYDGENLAKAYDTSFHFDAARDFTTLEYNLNKGDSENVFLTFFKKYFEVDESLGEFAPGILVRIDTTTIDLLDYNFSK